MKIKQKNQTERQRDTATEKTHSMTQKELRSSGKIEVRSTSTGRIATGYAIVFSPSRSEDLGGFVEQVDPGAVKLGQGNIWALRGHDSNAQLGSTDSGTLRLSKDAKGIRYELDIPNTSDGNDLVTLLQRGDGGQCSFGFYTRTDDFKVLPDGTVLRTLLDIEVFEISVGVVRPAYTNTTSALRSAPQFIREQIKKASKSISQRGLQVVPDHPSPGSSLISKTDNDGVVVSSKVIAGRHTMMCANDHSRQLEDLADGVQRCLNCSGLVLDDDFFDDAVEDVNEQDVESSRSLLLDLINRRRIA